MNLDPKQKRILLIVLFSSLGLLLIWAFHEGREEFEKERERERPVKSESRVSNKDGQSIITLEQTEQIKSGITSAPLEVSSHSEELRMQGTVVDIEDIPRGLENSDRLIQKQDILVEITLPINSPVTHAPQKAWIKTTDGVAPAELVTGISSGKNFFYRLSAESLKGFSWPEITIYLPVGPEIKGVVIPAAAVVWTDSKAWAYAQKDPEHFIRREVSTELPVKDGWFASKGFLAGEKVVTNGAQLLLSEEFRSQIKVGEEGEEENEKD